MKYIKLYIATILCLGALSAIYLPIYQTAATPVSEVLQISTLPVNSFINLSNMAPGDKITKSLRIMNSGNVNFEYVASARLEKGDQELFESLIVTINDKGTNLYNGSIKDFRGFALGSLTSHMNKDLEFSVELPKESGNEVKHKSSTVEFKFVATGELTEGEKGEVLPNTASNMYNNMIIGALLLLSGLIIIILSRKKLLRNQ